jgi:hypothetical protein
MEGSVNRIILLTQSTPNDHDPLHHVEVTFHRLFHSHFLGNSRVEHMRHCERLYVVGSEKLFGLPVSFKLQDSGFPDNLEVVPDIVSMPLFCLHTPMAYALRKPSGCPESPIRLECVHGIKKAATVVVQHAVPTSSGKVNLPSIVDFQNRTLKYCRDDLFIDPPYRSSLS